MNAPAVTLRRSQGQTPYEYRLGLVVAVLREQTDLDAAAAGEAAALVLHSIDTIPEHVR